MKSVAFPFKLVLAAEKLTSAQKLGPLSLLLSSYPLFASLQSDMMETTGGE